MVSPGHSQTPEILHSRRTLREPEEFSNVATGIELEVDYQQSGHRPSMVEHFISPGWALDFGEVRVATRTRGVLAKGWASLCLNLGSATAKWNGTEGPPGSVSLLPPGGELDGCTAAGFRYVTVAVSPMIAASPISDASPPATRACSG